MSLPFSDTFTAADGTLLNAYGSWSGSNTFSITGGKVFSSGVTNLECIHANTFNNSTYEVTYQLSTPPTNPSGLSQCLLVGVKCANGLVQSGTAVRIGLTVAADLSSAQLTYYTVANSPTLVSLPGNAVNRTFQFRVVIRSGTPDPVYDVYVDGVKYLDGIAMEAGIPAAPYQIGLRSPGVSAGGSFIGVDNLSAYVPSALTATASLTSRTAIVANLTVVPAGGSGSYSYQWREDTNRNVTPTSSSGTAIAGATSASFSYAIADKKLRWLFCVVTDTTTSSVVTSNAIPTRLLDGSIILGAVGSSSGVIDNSGASLGNVPTRIANQLKTWSGEYAVTMNNQCVNGTTINGWWPANRVATLAAFQAAGVQAVIVYWGVNDYGQANRSVSDYVADCLGLINDFASINAKTLLMPIQCATVYGNADNGYQYHFARAAIIDNKRSFTIDRDSLRFEMTAEDPSLLADGLHSGPILQAIEADWGSQMVARALGTIAASAGSASFTDSDRSTILAIQAKTNLIMPLGFSAIGYSLAPGLYESGATGRPVDFVTGSGASVGLIVGNVESASVPQTVIFQESNDQSTWTNIPNLTMPTIATDFDGVREVDFLRTKRYVRATFTPPNDFGANLAVLFGTIVGLESFTDSDRSAVQAIRTKTDLIPAQPAAVGSPMTLAAAAITDTAFGWNVADVTGVPTTVLGRLRRWIGEQFLPRSRNRTTGIETSYAADGTTALHKRTVTTSSPSGVTTDTVTASAP